MTQISTIILILNNNNKLEIYKNGKKINNKISQKNKNGILLLNKIKIENDLLKNKTL